MSRDEGTYGEIRRKYDAWVRAEAERHPREHLRRADALTPAPSGNTDMSRYIFAAIGIGLGLILLGLAGYAFYSAAYWGSFGRDGAQTGYVIVGVFLLIAGFGGIAATWNHNFRVLVRPPEQGHH